jgi:tRNA pseudouridine55 synthase
MVRRVTGEERVGHAGTLDPFASGVLVVGVGREATREFSKLVGLDKKYRATLHLGATSDTDDRTGQISTWQVARDTWPTGEEVKIVIDKFIGKIMQVPPMYSAKKIKGKKLYELAREGKTIERAAVPIEVYSISVVNYNPKPTTYNLVLDIHCSSGTYIRSLARDIGEVLGCGAYLEELERTAVGPFSIDEAVKIDDLNKDNCEKLLIPPETTINRCQKTGPMLG